MAADRWVRFHGAARNATALRQLLSMLVSDSLWAGGIQRGASVQYRFAVRPVRMKRRTTREATHGR
jgi:hypothetical protein